MQTTHRQQSSIQDGFDDVALLAGQKLPSYDLYIRMYIYCHSGLIQSFMGGSRSLKHDQCRLSETVPCTGTMLPLLDRSHAGLERR